VPEVSRFFGIIIKMFYNEHNPPHFHVEYQEYTAIISIENGIVKGEMPRKQLNLIFKWLDLHKAELLENWELSLSRQQLNKINPLNIDL